MTTANRQRAWLVAIAAVGLAAIVGGCGGVDIAPGTLACGPKGECPLDWTCVRMRCYPPGQDAAAPSDGGTGGAAGDAARDVAGDRAPGDVAMDFPGTGGDAGDAGTGGHGGSGGEAGTGGTGTGGAGTGGAGTGGAGTGGADAGPPDAGGSGGAGGAPGECQPTDKRCSGNAVQTCGNDQKYGPAIACGTHQTCSQTGVTAQCKCNAAPTCSSDGNVCESPTTLVTCAHDGDGCLFGTAATCTNGACSAGMCCVNACAAVGATCATATSVGTCVAAPNGCRVLNTAACGAGQACRRAAPTACFDPNWADWPMPNTAADAAAGAGTPMHLTDNGNGTITDNVTALMWQKMVTLSLYTWAEARTTCASLTVNGVAGWRLPSMIELISITNYDRVNPALNDTFFPNASGTFWSSTTASAATPDPWVINFDSGESTTASDAVVTTAYLRCVR